MSQENVELVRRGYEAFAQGDIEAALAMLHPDVQIEDHDRSLETPTTYGESTRAIEQQARMLDELRSRTGLLLAGASVVTSFLGAAAIERNGMDTLAVLAILVFLAVVGLSLWVLVPRTKAWRFALGATTLLEDWADEKRPCGTAAMQRFLATTIEKNWDHNDAKLEELYLRFQCAAGLLGLDVVLWTLELA